MGYSEAQRAKAIELVQQNGGVLDAATLDAVRAALHVSSLSQQLIRYWLNAESKAVKKSKRVKPDGLIEAPEITPTAPESSFLTGKQRAFVDAYLSNGFNATDAARQAGYSGDDHALAVIGSRNLRITDVRAEIDRLLAEQVMCRNEVLARLSDHARGNLGDVLDKDSLSLKKAEDGGKLHLIKKVKITRRTIDGEKIEYVELELHDPQAALVQLGRHYKLFTDRTEVDLPPELTRMLLELFGSAEKANEALKRLMDKRLQARVAAEGNGDV